jgi:hypothetical protein
LVGSVATPPPLLRVGLLVAAWGLDTIPSRFSAWHDGSLTMNITTDPVIEDPVFKPSNRSYFIQLADCVAYALLKREVPPRSKPG